MISLVIGIIFIALICIDFTAKYKINVVQSIITSLDIGPNNTQVGFLVFGTHPQVLLAYFARNLHAKISESTVFYCLCMMYLICDTIINTYLLTYLLTCTYLLSNYLAIFVFVSFSNSP